MDQIMYAYHVTDVSAEKPRPRWSFLQAVTANDLLHDGPLTGKICVFFSTTLREGELPTMSPYPRKGDSDENYWRVKIPMFEFNSYSKLWHINTFGQQIHLVFTKTKTEENVIKDLERVRQLDIFQNNGYLYRDSRQNWISANDKWVNFAVLHNFPIQVKYEWDTVQHITPLYYKSMIEWL